MEGLDPGQVGGSERPVHVTGDETEREEGVGADFLDEHDQCPAERRRPLDQGAAPKQIVRRSRDGVVPRVRPVRAVDHGESALRRILRHPVVDRGVLHRQADHRVSRHVVHALAAVPDGASVPQALHVLFRRHQWHRASLFGPSCWHSRRGNANRPDPVDIRHRAGARASTRWSPCAAPPAVAPRSAHCYAYLFFRRKCIAGLPDGVFRRAGECRCR